MKFTTVKQVKLAVWSQRNSLIEKYTGGRGRMPSILTECMDGNRGRIYHLVFPVETGNRYTFVRPFEEVSTWIQGGLTKEELLEWASKNLN